MVHFGFRYAVLVFAVLFVFTNFIACGSQLYQVSLDDDFESSKLPEEATNPNSTLYGIHASSGWNNLPIEYRFGAGMNDSQKYYLQKAMKSWEIAIGKPLFKFLGNHDGVSGDSFNDLYSSLKDKV